MFCAISGKTPEEPVVSTKTGFIYEKRLIHKYLEANNNVEPNSKEETTASDFIEVKANKIIAPRPTTATSIPALLQTFQNEWDAVMLETYTLKQQLDSVRQELAHSLYQHDAACRVIARLIRERDEAKNMLSNFRANMPAGASAPHTDSMDVETGFTEEIKAKLQAKSTELATDRKKRTVPDSLASVDDLKAFDAVSSVSLHKTTSPGITSVDLKQNLVLTGGVDGDVIVFNHSDNKIVGTYAGHSKKVTDVAFHPTSDVFFSASADKTAKIWVNGKNEHTIKTHSAEVSAISLHATGDYLGTASHDKTWALSDIHSGKNVTQVHGDSAFTAASFHPDGLILGTGNVAATVKIWDVKSQKNVASFEGHKGKIVDLAFSENGYYLATTAEDNVVKLWDLRKLKNIQSANLPEDFNVTSVDFDYSGTYLAVSGNDVRVFIGKTLTHVSSYSKHTASVTDVKWGKDAQSFVSVSLDRSLKYWSKK